MNQTLHAPRMSDLAYERILQALFDARVPMGGRINQQALVELIGIPVGPVRDALKILEADGLVKVYPRSGIELISPSADLVRSTFQFRTMIERPAARRFAMSVSSEALEALIRDHDEMEKTLSAMAPNENAFDALSFIETRFHLSLVASLGNELIDAAYRRLQLMSRIVRGKAVVFPQVAKISVSEHLLVLDACARRDGDAADAAIGDHLTRAMNRNLGVI